MKEQHNETPKSALFTHLEKYSGYILGLMLLQVQRSYPPISVYEKPNGETVGFVFFKEENSCYRYSMEEIIAKMEEKFEKQLANNEILSYVILYHSQFDNDGNHQAAEANEEYKAISVSYNFENFEKGKIGMPYRSEDKKIKFSHFNKLTTHDNIVLMRSKVMGAEKCYQEMVEMTAPTFVNEIGITIKKANTLNLVHTWEGVLGFETFNESNGKDTLKESFTSAMRIKPTVQSDNLTISELDFTDIKFRAITYNERLYTILPEVKTNYKLDFETIEITEWENYQNIKAIIYGGGREEIALSFLATDYAENREIYKSNEKLDLNISGIAFVLDIFEGFDSDGELNFADNFTSIMPYKEFPNYACFEFYGQLISFKESNLLEDNNTKGYLLNVRLITIEDIEDYFTIDIFVNQENMRFSELEIGMKLKGLLQLQGKIAD